MTDDLLLPDSPCTVTTVPQEKGGVRVTVMVPTYSGGAEFTISVERSPDGDWMVFIPWTAADDDGPVLLADGCECSNGIVYIGAPDVPIKRRQTT